MEQSVARQPGITCLSILVKISLWKHRERKNLKNGGCYEKGKENRKGVIVIASGGSIMLSATVNAQGCPISGESSGRRGCGTDPEAGLSHPVR